MSVCIKLKEVYIAPHHHVSRSFVFVHRNKRWSGIFLQQTLLLDRGIWTLSEGTSTFSYRRDLAYTTQHIKCSLQPPSPLTFFVFYGAPLLLTHIRVCSRTSVVLLPRFLCFPTRYIIEVAFHPPSIPSIPSTPSNPSWHVRASSMPPLVSLLSIMSVPPSFAFFRHTHTFFYLYTNVQCIYVI